MNNINTITFANGDTVTFTDAVTITTVVSGVTAVFTTTSAPSVAPTDTEVDILLSDGSTKTFVPKV